VISVHVTSQQSSYSCVLDFSVIIMSLYFFGCYFSVRWYLSIYYFLLFFFIFSLYVFIFFFFFQAEDGIRDFHVTGVQTCALPISETEIIAGGVEEFFSMQQMEDGLVRAIHNLPINMKRSFLLRRNNMSIKEIALRLNLAEQTVTNNIAEAVKRLRKEFVNKTQENIYEL